MEDKPTLKCNILRAEQGAIDNFSCKKCRISILKQLCIMLSIPIGGIFLYFYAYLFTVINLDLSFSMAFDNSAFWVAIACFTMWFFTCKIGFNIVESMNWNLAYWHCKNHLPQQTFQKVEDKHD